MKNPLVLALLAFVFSNVASAAQEGYTAPSPFETYRTVFRCETMHTAKGEVILGEAAPVIVAKGDTLYLQSSAVVPNPEYSYTKLDFLGQEFHRSYVTQFFADASRLVAFTIVTRDTEGFVSATVSRGNLRASCWRHVSEELP